MRFRLRTLLIALAVLPPLLAAAGISWFGLRQEPPEVSGRVTYLGQPANAVDVVFELQEKSPPRRFAARTDVAGHFQLALDQAGRPLRPGRYTVTLSAPALPARYQTASSSGLTVLVSKGDGQFDFDLQ
jgi:hypothetical protein